MSNCGCGNIQCLIYGCMRNRNTEFNAVNTSFETQKIKKIIEYTTVYESIIHLDAVVMELIEKGWVPYGFPIPHNSIDAQHHIIQVMVKYEDK